MGEVGKKGIGETSTGPFEAAAIVWLCTQLCWETDPGVASVALTPVKLFPTPQALVLRLLSWKQELRVLLSLACLSLSFVTVERA